MDVSGVDNSTAIKEDFLRLFVAQLKNQSPLDPLKGHEFIAQLAQFTSLEQLTNLNVSFSDILKYQQLLGGGELIGRNATYLDTDAGGESQGIIDGVKISDGTIAVVIQNKEIPISNLTGIF
ncbi:MAG: flagellar hook capping FlgD N-terminal domain-containing protein [Candidatus Scalinduaceae bacterium]